MLVTNVLSTNARVGIAVDRHQWATGMSEINWGGLPDLDAKSRSRRKKNPDLDFRSRSGSPNLLEKSG